MNDNIAIASLDKDLKVDEIHAGSLDLNSNIEMKCDLDLHISAMEDASTQVECDVAVLHA